MYAKFIPMSTEHWPGKISFVVLFSGSDFRCGFYNSDFVEFKNECQVDIKDLKKKIEENLSFIDCITFTGGEPCLQKPPLMTLLRFARKLNLNTAININGTKHLCLKDILKHNLVDYLIFNLNAPFEENTFEKITKSSTFFRKTKEIIDDIKQSLELLKTANINIEIRTKIVPGLIYRKEDILLIANEIKDIDCTWVLEQFRPQENLVDRKLENISPPTLNFLENLKESILKEYSIKVEVKGE